MSSLPVISTRYQGETIPSYFCPRHEDLTQVMVADVERVDVLVWIEGQDEPEFEDELLVADVMFDTPRAWPVDSIGYTFLHTLPYGDDFEPPPGVCTVKYYLWRTDDRGPVILTHEATLLPDRGIADVLP